jgi:predicted nucleotidyltransferase
VERGAAALHQRDELKVEEATSLRIMRPMSARIAVDRAKLADFCRRNHIVKLALFGSVLRDDFRPDSDVDVLVEFEPGHTPGLAFFSLEDELSELLDRKVDLNTPGFLSRHFRDAVAAEAEVQYAAA